MATVDEKEEEKSNNTKFLESAKDFSFDQKLSVVQSILGGIPREQQQPWNVSQSSWEKRSQCKAAGREKEIPESGKSKPTASSTNVATKSGEIDVFLEPDSESTNQPLEQAPPLLDPYERSMKYYEKHLVLNHFQHMTAKLVLQRPENTLQFMIDWCKDMQKKRGDNDLQSKTLFEENKIDVYDDDITNPLIPETSSNKTIKSKEKLTSYGNNMLTNTSTVPSLPNTKSHKDQLADSRQSGDGNQKDSLVTKETESARDSGIGRTEKSLPTSKTENGANSQSKLATSEDELSLSAAEDDIVSVSTTSELSAS